MKKAINGTNAVQNCKAGADNVRTRHLQNVMCHRDNGAITYFMDMKVVCLCPPSVPRPFKGGFKGVGRASLTNFLGTSR